MKRSTVRNFLIVCFTQAVLYLVLFLIIPYFLIKLANDWLWLWVPTLLSIVICSYGLWVLVPKLRFWFLGIPILWGLILIYHPLDIYGISDGRFGFDVFPSYIDALLFAVKTFLLQCIIKIAWVLKCKITGDGNS